MIDPHKDRCPFGEYRGMALVKIPLSYLRWLAAQPHDRSHWPEWIDAAKVELDRRCFIDDGAHFSEHSIERYSQRALGMEKGIISQMKAEFDRALKQGEWVRENELVLRQGQSLIKWKVNKWQDVNMRDRYQVISYVVAGQSKNGRNS